MLDPFQLPYVQRGVLEILLLAVPAGLLGTWIVLRGLAFHAHAVGTAAFPGLVLAGGLGFAAALGALGAALAMTGAVALLARRRDTTADSRTAIVLVGMLAAGIVLASDVFHSAASVDSLLFGSVLLLAPRDIALAGAAAAMALAATELLGPRWLASGFDPETARATGARSGAREAALLVAVTLAVVAALAAVGALMVTALFVVPAATARLVLDRMGRWQAASVALAAVEGVSGIWLAVRLNAPPGATIAVLSGAVFALAVGARALRRRRPRPAVAAAGLAALALACAAAGCGSGSAGGGGGGVDGKRIDVVATTTQAADFVRNVGGSRVKVTQILQPNTDPHSYEPRPDDVAAVAGAKILFTSGDGLDAWASKLVAQSGGSPEVVDLGADVPVRLTGSSGKVDPHWWHDPVDAQAAVARIRETLDRADPRGAPVYQARATSYLTKLGVLDKGIQACLATIPRGERTLVTDHDAFAYFAKRYGIAVVGAVIPSQSTQAQPSAADVKRLIGLIRARRVRAIFPESSLNARLAQAIARETGARVGAPLYGDTLGPKGSRGAGYLAMEQANADAMARGFSGGRVGCAIPGIP